MTTTQKAPTAAAILAALRADRAALEQQQQEAVARAYAMLQRTVDGDDGGADLVRNLWELYRRHTLELEAVNRTVRRWESLAAVEAQQEREA